MYANLCSNHRVPEDVWHDIKPPDRKKCSSSKGQTALRAPRVQVLNHYPIKQTYPLFCKYPDGKHPNDRLLKSEGGKKHESVLKKTILAG